MKTLEPPDTFYYTSAIGWLELGNKTEAAEELKHLSSESQEHPDVLELRWNLAANAKNWEDAAEIAAAMIRVSPEREFGWIHRSYSLHELKRTQEAWDALLPAAKMFPQEFLVPYNLACYAAALENLDEARFWLSKAIIAGGIERVRSMAMQDVDLKSLWPEIQGLTA